MNAHGSKRAAPRGSGTRKKARSDDVPSPTASPFPIERLPSDLLQLVISFIPMRARLLVMPFVSTRWRALARRTIVALPRTLAPSRLSSALSVLPSVTSLAASFALPSELRLPSHLQSLSISSSISPKNWATECPCKDFLPVSSIKMLALTCHGCTNYLPVISNNAMSLETLTIDIRSNHEPARHRLTQLQNLLTNTRFPHLTALTLRGHPIDNELIIETTSVLRSQLKSLAIEGRDYKNALSKLADFEFSRLEELQLDVERLSADWIIGILSHAPLLQRLRLSCDIGIGVALLQHVTTCLTDLVLRGSRREAENKAEVVAMLSQCTALTHLTMHTRLLAYYGPTEVLMPHLRRLRVLRYNHELFQWSTAQLRHLSNLVRLEISQMDMHAHGWSVSLPNVRELCWLSSPFNFSRMAQYVTVLRRFLANFPNLRVLELDGVPYLQHANHRLVLQRFFAEAVQQGVEIIRVGVPDSDPQILRKIVGQSPWVEIEQVPRHTWHDAYSDDSADDAYGGAQMPPLPPLPTPAAMQQAMQQLIAPLMPMLMNAAGAAAAAAAGGGGGAGDATVEGDDDEDDEDEVEVNLGGDNEGEGEGAGGEAEQQLAAPQVPPVQPPVAAAIGGVQFPQIFNLPAFPWPMPMPNMQNFGAGLAALGALGAGGAGAPPAAAGGGGNEEESSMSEDKSQEAPPHFMLPGPPGAAAVPGVVVFFHPHM